VRLKGYDPDEVRRFLDQVAAVFRVAVADDHGRAPTNQSDLGQVLAAANDAADKIIADAERQAAALVAKADDKHTRADEHAARAQNILERAQARSASIADDCRTARQTLADAEAKAADIIAVAQDDAAQVALTARAKTVAAEMDAELEASMRASLDQIDAAADAKLAEVDRYVAERKQEADKEAARVVAEAEDRVELLAAREHALRARVSEGQSELRALAARFAGDDDVTIDLTGSDADDADRLIAFEGSYSEALVERGDRAERREWSERDDVPDGEGSDEFLDEELFPELHDGSSPLAEVQLEWNKPKWARSQQAASAS
jgi:hypothetical protein